MLFEWCSICEIPSDAVEPAKNDAEEGEDDHARIFVALRPWCVERRNMRSTRRDGVGCDNSEDGREYKTRNKRVKKGRSRMMAANRKRNSEGRKSQPMTKAERDLSSRNSLNHFSEIVAVYDVSR